MKTLFYGLIGLLLGMGTGFLMNQSNQTALTLGAPTKALIYQATLIPLSDSQYDLGTSTQAWRDVFSDRFCLTADTCITSWSTGTGDITGASNLGTGLNIFDTENAGILRFNSLAAGTNITLSTTSNANTIVINSSGGGAIFTNPLSVGYLLASSTATSTFSGGLEALIIGARNFFATSTATSSFPVAYLGTTTISNLNGVIVVDGIRYPKTGAGIENAISDCAAMQTCGKVFLTAGTYPTDYNDIQSIRLRSHVDLEGAGATSTIISEATGGTSHTLSNEDNAITDVTLSNFTLEGNNTNSGIFFSGATQKKNITIKNLLLKNCSQRCIEVQATDNLVIQNNVIASSTKGILLRNSVTDFNISNNLLEGGTDSGTAAGIDLSISMTATNGVIANNIIHDYDSAAGVAYGILFDNAMSIQNVSVTGNTIYNIGVSGLLGDGIAAGNGGNVKFLSITGNSIREVSDTGVDIMNTKNVTVSGNSIYRAGSTGIVSWGSYNTITGNTIDSVGYSVAQARACIDLWTGGSTNNVVTGNTCVDTQGTPTTDYGIWVQAGNSNNVISGNNVDITVPVDVKMDDEGNLFVKTIASSTVRQMIVAATSSTPIFVVQPAGLGQVANIFEVQNNSNSTLFSVDTLGNSTTTGYFAATGVATSTISRGLEVGKLIAAPTFNATSTTATSTFMNGLNINGGSLLVTSSASTRGLILTGTNSFDNTKELISSNATGNIDIQGRGSLNVYLDSNANGTTDFFGLFRNGSTDRFFTALENTGNVGIGTTSPYARLSVAGDIVGGWITATTSTSTLNGLKISNILSCSGSNALTTGSAGEVGCGAISGVSAASSTLLADSNTFSGLNKFTNAGTTTFSGGIEAGTLISAPYFHATSTKTSVFAGELLNTFGYIVSQDSLPIVELKETDSAKVGGMYMAGGELRIYAGDSYLTNNGQVRIMNDLDLQGVAISGQFTPDLADTYDIGSTVKPWAGLWLGPDECINFGAAGNDFCQIAEGVGTGDQGLLLEPYTANNGASGKVGVGTTTPWAMFSVGSSTPTNTFPLVAFSTSSTAFLIDSSGKVGVGTTTPGADFAVSGLSLSGYLNTYNTGATSAIAGALTVGNTTLITTLTGGKIQLGAGGTVGTPGIQFPSNTAGIYNPVSGILGFGTNGVEAARFDGLQRFGIGTSSPFSILSVSATSSLSNLPVFAVSAVASAGATTTVMKVDSSGRLTIQGQYAGLTASTTGSTAMTIDWNSGNTQRVVLGGNTQFVINATSSNPIDGGKYLLKVCQGGAGNYTGTFVTPGQLRFIGITPATTTIPIGVGQCAFMGFIYDGLYQTYQIASTTGTMR